jgi:hypothetical protein
VLVARSAATLDQTAEQCREHGVDVAEPADVAREGLEWLGRGPVHIVSGNEQIVDDGGERLAVPT